MSDPMIPIESARAFNIIQYEQIRRLGEEFTADSEFRLQGVRNLDNGYGLRITYRLKDHEVTVVGDEVDDVLNDPAARDDLFMRWTKEVRSSKTLIPEPPPKVRLSAPTAKVKPTSKKQA